MAAETLRPITEVTGEFIRDHDERIRMALSGKFDTEYLDRVLPTWSMEAWCQLSNDLKQRLSSEGYEAGLLLNRAAFTSEIETSGDEYLKATSSKHHVVVGVDTNGRRLYIDAFWQQFVVDLGLDIAIVQRCPSFNLQPTERVICYEAEDLSDVRWWFASTARAVQDKLKTGVLRADTDVFSRPLPTVVQLFLGEVRGPISYTPFATLQKMADRIWNPKYYQPTTPAELEGLVATLRGTEEPA